MALVALPASGSSLHVIDGDTVIVEGETIRLTSEVGPIDAPEIHQHGPFKAKCPLELFRAQAARERLSQLLAPGDFSIDRGGRPDRYGRTVARIYADGLDVGSILLKEGLAKRYRRPFRLNKPDWCGPGG